MLTHSTDLDKSHSILHFKIRASALKQKAQQFDCVEEFCGRLNRLKSKSDAELLAMGLDRSEIGSHVLHRLIN